MTESVDWHDQVSRRVAEETDLIVGAFADAEPPDRRDIGVVAGGNGIDFMYAEGEILIREPYLGQVLQILESRNRDDVEQNEPGRILQVIEGVVLLRLAGERFTRVLDALDEIDQRLGPGVATPNQVLTVANGEASGCSATEPQEAYYAIEPYPSVCHDGGGAGVLIYMADTGLLKDAATHPWLAHGVDMENPLTDVDPLDPGDPPVIPACAGHGTFGAGVLRCVAPEAQIVMTRALLYGGSQVESDLVPVLESALSLGADIYHLTVACMSRKNLALIGFEVWLRHLRSHQGAICIAPAGNNDFARPEWPAAFPGVISVGALGGDWRGRATFSNFGPWVDVYAPGRDLVNAFATGAYKCYVYPYKDDDRKFYGMAKWSGTSFSAPIVTGSIAARMSRTGETARQAAAAVLAEARRRAIPGVGPVVLPCCGHDRPPACHQECCCREPGAHNC
jgi:Subtilase family